MAEANLKEVLLEPARSCAYFHTRRATRVLAAHYDRVLAPHGLRGTQFTLLAAIALHGTAKTSELARTIGADRTTLTRNLAVLKRAMYIDITDGADRRERLHSLTDAGSAKLAAAVSAWRSAQAELTAAIGPDTFEALLNATAAITALMADRQEAEHGAQQGS